MHNLEKKLFFYIFLKYKTTCFIRQNQSNYQHFRILRSARKRPILFEVFKTFTHHILRQCVEISIN